MAQQYKKGQFGYLLDMRKAMARVKTIATEWCRAFDVGDTVAAENLGELLGEAMRELGDASEKVNSFKS